MVLDLFSGSGTTAFVARKLGRDFIGCENDKDYHTHLTQRLNEIER
jgi:site-specific DNA-methyltransferase (adenine-specific)